MKRTMRPASATASLLLMCALAGCASVNPEPDYLRAAEHARRATGQPRVYRPGEEAAAAARVDELLADGLTADEAAQIALLNNPKLQAAFYRIGVARAEVVQSGLLANPSLGMALRLPAGGGLAALEADVAQNIADLWQIPVRRRAAERALDRVILDIGAQAAEIAAEAKSAYYAAAGADHRFAIAEENLEITRTVLELTEFRKSVGAGSELDVNLARGIALEAELAVQRSRLAAAEARRALLVALGLSIDADALVLAEPLGQIPACKLDAEALSAVALVERLDVRAVRQAVRAAEQQLVLECRRVFPSLEIGVSLERGERGRAERRDLLADTARASIASGQLSAPNVEPRSARRTNTDFSIGPSLALELPIFDQNQAGIARARYELERRLHLLDGLERTVRQNVRGAVDQAHAAWRVARFYRDEIVPQAQRSLEMSRQSYRAGKSSVLSVLDAERTYLSARDRYAEALQAAASAVPLLERTAGLPINRLTTASESAVSDLPVEPAEADDGDSNGDSSDGVE